MAHRPVRKRSIRAIVVLGVGTFAGVCLLPVSLGLGIAALVVRRRGPAPQVRTVWGATSVEPPLSGRP